jgi:hypothetical protein
MYNVVITYVNGEKVEVPAQEFDVDFRTTAQGEGHARIMKRKYKDGEGNDTFIYLTPDQVAGIVLLPQ